MNLFTRNSPYYHLLNYLLFLLKHPVDKANSEMKYPYTFYVVAICFSVSVLLATLTASINLIGAVR